MELLATLMVSMRTVWLLTVVTLGSFSPALSLVPAPVRVCGHLLPLSVFQVHTKSLPTIMHSLYSLLYLTVFDCGTPSSPSDGQVTTPSGTLVGDVALYTCNEGLVLTGSNTRVCSNNGVWTPGPPTCEVEGINYIYLYILSDCTVFWPRVLINNNCICNYYTQINS